MNSNVNVPIPERKWIDIDPQPFDRSCFEVSIFMTRTLRHEASIPRIEKLKEEFGSSLQWTVNTWVNSLAKGGGKKKRCQCCLNPYSSKKILYVRAIQGHSEEIFVDPSLQDKKLLPTSGTSTRCTSRWTDPTEGTDSQCSSQQ